MHITFSSSTVSRQYCPHCLLRKSLLFVDGKQWFYYQCNGWYIKDISDLLRQDAITESCTYYMTSMKTPPNLCEQIHFVVFIHNHEHKFEFNIMPVLSL